MAIYDDKAYLGTGMKFPPQIDPATGRIMTSSAEQSVRESIHLILTTQLTERPLRPGFGTNLMAYAFMDFGVTELTMAMRTIHDQILTQEPRISDVEITADTESRDGAVLFQIDYMVRATNTRENMVFPFYLNGVTEEEEYEPENYEPEPVEEITY